MRVKQETTSTLQVDPGKRWSAVWRRANGCTNVQCIVALFEDNVEAMAWAEETFEDGLWGIDNINITQASMKS